MRKQLQMGTARQPGEVLDCVVEDVLIIPAGKAVICRHSEIECYVCLYRIDDVTPEVGAKGTVTIATQTSWRFDPLVAGIAPSPNEVGQ